MNTSSCSGAAITWVNTGSEKESVILIALLAFSERLFRPKPSLYWLFQGEMPMLGVKSTPQTLTA